MTDKAAAQTALRVAALQYADAHNKMIEILRNKKPKGLVEATEEAHKAAENLYNAANHFSRVN